MLKNKLYVYGGEDFKVPAHLNFGQQMLDRIWEYRDRVAVINSETDETITYRELAQSIVNIALTLKKHGIGSGQRVGICSEKRAEFLPTLIGGLCAGATFSPADITCGRSTLLHRVNIARPSVMFCSPNGWKLHKDTLKTLDYIKIFVVFGDEQPEGALRFKDFVTESAEVDDFRAAPVKGVEDLALLLYSSGTTGLPKGIKLNHVMTLQLVQQIIVNENHSNKRLLNTREWYYSYGMLFTMSYLHSGGTVVYSPHNEEKYFLEAIEKYKIQVIQLAPVTIGEFVKSQLLEKYDVSSVEVMLCASTPLDANLAIEVKKRFPNLRNVFQLYGMSEAGIPCREESGPKGSKPGSVGPPNNGLVLKVVDVQTRVPLPARHRGEICVKAENALMLGYTGVDVPTDSVFDDEGFYKTGDIGYYDEDGYFYIVDRIKELIKFNSFQVAPAELEAVLLQHPSIREAGVVGAPHPQYGQAPTAFVALQPGKTASEEEIVKYVDGEVSHRMRLAGGVRFVDALPRGAGGKLNRNALKEML